MIYILKESKGLDERVVFDGSESWLKPRRVDKTYYDEDESIWDLLKKRATKLRKKRRKAKTYTLYI